MKVICIKEYNINLIDKFEKNKIYDYNEIESNIQYINNINYMFNINFSSLEWFKYHFVKDTKLNRILYLE